MPKTICYRRPTTACQCRFAGLAPSHHDMLVNVDVDVAMAVELLELATTWEELDYSREAVIPPGDWLDFAAAHNWRDPDLAFRLFGVATDVASRKPQPALAARLR